MKVIFNILIFYFLFSVFGSIAFSEETREHTPQYIFYKANALYEGGKYDAAIREYEHLLEQGLESGNLYYNLGNAYFKSGRLGKAVLYYERARKLIPRDSDLRSNYDYSKSLVKEKVSGVPRSWILELLNRFSGYFTIDGLTLFVFYAYVLIILFAILALLFKPLNRFSKYLIISTALILVTGLLALSNRIRVEGKEGIVIAQDSEARFEPFKRATVHFSVYEGMKIMIIKQKGDWCRIKRPDGKIGWISNQDIEKI